MRVLSIVLLVGSTLWSALVWLATGMMAIPRVRLEDALCTLVPLAFALLVHGFTLKIVSREKSRRLRKTQNVLSVVAVIASALVFVAHFLE